MACFMGVRGRTLSQWSLPPRQHSLALRPFDDPCDYVLITLATASSEQLLNRNEHLDKSSSCYAYCENKHSPSRDLRRKKAAVRMLTMGLIPCFAHLRTKGSSLRI
jgi:ABC-type nickel/cobalt efflux system permease component RcnA